MFILSINEQKQICTKIVLYISDMRSFVHSPFKYNLSCTPEGSRKEINKWVRLQ